MARVENANEQRGRRGPFGAQRAKPIQTINHKTSLAATLGFYQPEMKIDLSRRQGQ
jgi:hypothetical protein